MQPADHRFEASCRRNTDAGNSACGLHLTFRTAFASHDICVHPGWATLSRPGPSLLQRLSGGDLRYKTLAQPESALHAAARPAHHGGELVKMTESIVVIHLQWRHEPCRCVCRCSACKAAMPAQQLQLVKMRKLACS